MNYGRYEIIKEVGRGAMGVVYQARDPHIDRLVALKVLRQDRVENEAFVKRFIKEAKVIGRLSHPHIVTIYDVGEEQGNIYIAMEFLEGVSLADVIRDKRPEPKEVAEFGIMIAETLDYAHRKGVVHRDIKPSNIIVQPDSGIKITDFGIARVEDSSSTLQTQTGEILGTPAYMSPEQVLGDPVDGRSDLFSLGVILYEMSTGRRPFGGGGKTLATVFADIMQGTPAEPDTVSAGVPARLSACIMKALVKDPAKRFQSGSEFAGALRETMGEKATPPPVAKAPPGKKRSALIPVVVVIAAVSAIGGFYFIKVYEEKTTSSPVTTVPLPQRTVETVQPPEQRETVPVAPPHAPESKIKPEEGKVQSHPVKAKIELPVQKEEKPVKKPPPVKPEPAKLATMVVRSSPSGAEIFVDGNQKGKAPLTLALPRGKHLVRAVHPGYDTIEKEINLGEAREYPIVLSLKAKKETDDWIIKPLVDRPGQ